MWSTSFDKLQSMLDECIDRYGYELVHFELVGRETSRVLRLYIDAPGGINLEDCTFVSQQIGKLLDLEDPIPGRYTLEVSSPGVERPLAKPEHFKQYLGERVEVLTHRKCDERRRFLGKLLSADDTQLVIDVDTNSYTIDFSNVRKANLKPEFDQLN